MTRPSENAALNWPSTAGASIDSPELESLITRCISGDDSAYLAVYNLFEGTLYRLCISLLRNRQDAEEVLQDTFEYAFRRLELYDSNRASLKTWLYQIAVSRCRNKRRRKLLPQLSFSHLKSLPADDDISRDPAYQADLTDRQRLVWKALGRLSPKLRETAVLRYYENMSYAEIGEVLCVRPKTIESRMRLAHNSLRQIFTDLVEEAPESP